jgi:enoyl-CoA hydratase/3-hydroxypropionyl-coenzyme A dehydratase
LHFKTIKVEASAPVGTLTLNRPEKRNALSMQMIAELRAAALWFDEQEAVRAVVVAGEGRAFCAGADLAWFDPAGNPNFHREADSGRCMAEALEQMRAVTVAAIHGACIGGGLVLAAACDLRVAGESAHFSIPEVDLGIPLAWGGVPRLMREIGPALTRELVMTCRKFEAAEALACGFLNRVVPDETVARTAQDLAQVIAAKPRSAILATKRHVNAVSAQMVGTSHGWSDADGLLAAFLDEEAAAVRRRYLAARGS